jgi:hypothetical protein
VTDADLIWNRAALENGGKTPACGDVALASLLVAHGYVMNGGVLHAAECLDVEQLADAQYGYRFFGLAPVAEMLSSARQLVDSGRETEEDEFNLDADYVSQIPDDSALAQRFELHLRAHPHDFAPL